MLSGYHVWVKQERLLNISMQRENGLPLDCKGETLARAVGTRGYRLTANSDFIGS